MKGINPMKRLVAFAAAALVCGALGCGRTATVSGKVTYQGKPVLSGSVIVLSWDGTARSGVIYADGSYKVEGVKKGAARLGVFSPDPATAHSILHHAETSDKNSGKPEKGKSPGWFPLPRALGDPATSGQKCDVTSSRVQFDIELK
jgi:hypothetical protein